MDNITCAAPKYTSVERAWLATASPAQRLEFQSARHGVTVDSWFTSAGYYFQFECGHTWFSPVFPG
ncbi:hypothetical protein SEA_YUUY_52 [Microbacterium phage YuuY]|nr:hypothetical protein SEA_YUUY_52 [Microbacterium phage YuuY]